MRKKDQWVIHNISTGESKSFDIKTPKRSAYFHMGHIKRSYRRPIYFTLFRTLKRFKKFFAFRKNTFKKNQLFSRPQTRRAHVEIPQLRWLFSNTIKGGLTVLISVLVIYGVVYAGTITPPSGTPSAQFYTLSEIYNFITSNTTSTEGGHSFTFSDSLAGTGRTLSEIYNALASLISANKVKLGTTYLGTAGTLVPSGGTATTSNVLAGKTYFGDSQTDWNLQTGTMANNGAFSLTASSSDQTVTAGYYSGGTLAGDADLVAGNIKNGVNIFGTIGSLIAGYLYGDSDQSKVLTTASGAGTYNASNLSVGVVKSGTTFATSSTGAYPSATYPLPSADGGVTDLAASGGNVSSSNGAVEWWQSDGTRQTATLDFPTLSNVCSSDTSNNSAGTLTVTAAYLGVGNTWCGAAGTLLANLFSGTSGAFTGGSQANGGADDYNNGGSPSSGRYAMGWTACNAGNNYCGTGDTGADAKDDSTGLIWSMPCNGSGCASFSDASPLTYSWDNSAANNNSRTASQLCSDHTGWYLPHQKQLMQAYIDGSYGNLEASGVTRFYWSASTVSYATGSAWGIYLSRGYTTFGTKTDSYYVRCVRSAN